jgi:hypothetical protein
VVEVGHLVMLFLGCGHFEELSLRGVGVYCQWLGLQCNR